MSGQVGNSTYLFTRDAVFRAIETLTEAPIHEHFAGYLAILRALRARQGEPARMADITIFHDRYLAAKGYPENSPYVRPFKSRGKGGLEAFNANVAGSYAPSSLRSAGKLIDVVLVEGERRNATYSLQENHAPAALDGLLRNNRVPVVSLIAFLYRDYGFRLGERSVARTMDLFRDEFGLRSSEPNERETYNLLFRDDSSNFVDKDLEPFQPAVF